jgi:hypothetical protein
MLSPHNDAWSDEDFFTDLVPDLRAKIGDRRNGGRQAMPERGDSREGEIETPLPEDMRERSLVSGLR